MDVGKVWHLPQAKDAGGEPYDEEVRFLVIRAAHDLAVLLIEVVPLVHTPACVGDCNAKVGRCGRNLGFVIRVV